MKYSIRYYSDCPKTLLTKADDIIFENVNNAIAYIHDNEEIEENQRITIQFTLTEEKLELVDKAVSTIKNLMKSHKNIVIRTKFDNPYLITLTENNIPYYFSDFCNSWDKVYTFIQRGSSELFICNELGFSLDKIKTICDKNNVKIRVLPNVAQTAVPTNDNLKSFFIRPEDVCIYDKYVDYFEFWGQKDRQEILLEIYKSNNWEGNLKELIQGLNLNLYSSFIVPVFAVNRIKCDKECYQNGKCDICGKVLALSQALEEEGKRISVEKL